MRAILTYEDLGANGISGQTIGANGYGKFCIIYHGDEEKIQNEAAKLLSSLAADKRLGIWMLIYDGKYNDLQPVTEVNL